MGEGKDSLGSPCTILVPAHLAPRGTRGPLVQPPPWQIGSCPRLSSPTRPGQSAGGTARAAWGGVGLLGPRTSSRTHPTGPCQPCQPSCGGTRPAPSAFTSILLPPPTGLGAGPGVSDVAEGCVGGEGGPLRVPSPAPPSVPQPPTVPIFSLTLNALPS